VTIPTTGKVTTPTTGKAKGKNTHHRQSLIERAKVFPNGRNYLGKVKIHNLSVTT
jgi:hypothetical protein